MARKITPQRVLMRFIETHGAKSINGWSGDRGDMDTMQILLQACEVHRGVRDTVDVSEAEAETDRLFMIRNGAQ